MSSPRPLLGLGADATTVLNTPDGARKKVNRAKVVRLIRARLCRLAAWAPLVASLGALTDCGFGSTPSSDEHASTDPVTPVTPVTPAAPIIDQPYVSDVPDALPLAATQLEAEAGETTGTVRENDAPFHSRGAEASGGSYVELAPGQKLTLHSPVPADSLVVRFSYPDSPEGTGLDGSIDVQVGGSTVNSLPVTSRFSWEYGDGRWGTSNVWSSSPTDGDPRHFWDESSLRLAVAINENTELGLSNPAGSGQSVYIDLIELESIGEAVSAPPDSISLADFAPAADGVTDDTKALQSAINQASAMKLALYVPEGTYHVGSISLRSGTVQGAGMWRTRFVGKGAQVRMSGGTVHLADFAIFGETTTRSDASQADNAFDGSPGADSLIERVWVEHTKCAYWVAGATRLRISSCRFRDLMADAVNFCGGVHQSILDNTQIRNSGDDSLAAWSPASSAPGDHNLFAYNTIQSPWLANGIALYGAGPFRVVGNTIKDIANGGAGINVAASFGSHPFRGLVDVRDNELVRCGVSSPSWARGAFQLSAYDADMTGAEFVFSHNLVRAPLGPAVSCDGSKQLTNVLFTDLQVEASSWVAYVSRDAVGAATFENVTVSDAKPAEWQNDAPETFTLTTP